MDEYYIIQTITFMCHIGILSWALSLNYLTDDVPNYALGSFFAVGSLASWEVTKSLGLSPYYGILAGFLSGAVLNVCFYWFVIRKAIKRKISPVLLVLLCIGANIIVTSINQIYWFVIRERFTTISLNLLLRLFDSSIFGVPLVAFVSVSMVILVVLGSKSIQRNRIGVTFRAVKENPELAMVQGVTVDQVKAWIWMISGGISGIVGSLYIIMFSTTPSGHYILITAVLAGAFLGGIRNPLTALMGGLVVGLLRFALYYVGKEFIGVWVGEFLPLIPVVVLALVMYFSPEGVLRGDLDEL